MEAGTLRVQAGAVPDRLTEPRARVEDFERIEDYLRACLDDERFTSSYARAHRRWSDAWAMLWQADSTEKLIAVTADAREAMCEFASVLVEWNEPAAESAGSSEPLACLSSAIETCRPALGDSRCRLLESLFDYWRALSDLVQRHEQRVASMPERLRWEDGRRLVVLTALLMVELDRCLTFVQALA